MIIMILIFNDDNVDDEVDVHWTDIIWPVTKFSVAYYGLVADMCDRHVHFVTTGFYEEQAILLGKRGRHEEALAIYVHVLHDNRMAEEWACLIFSL